MGEIINWCAPFTIGAAAILAIFGTVGGIRRNIATFERREKQRMISAPQ